MKVLLQRVLSASVDVDGIRIAEISRGLLLLCGFAKEDSAECLAKMAKKIVNMRVFPDEKGRFDRSLIEEELSLLAVPQFTLYADTSKGRRPEFFSAKNPAEAEELFRSFVIELNKTGVRELGQGRFGADMQVELINDGPVTILLEL
ncbi:UNVERIFIED_CONTAM: hypothetical protein GTU68_061396 [Idotea baltica]|nr:hypothetical protein [Idotea baltica]